MRKQSRTMIWFAPIPIAMAAFFASVPWLSKLDDAVSGRISAAVVVFVLAWGYFVWGRRQHRLMDEVQIAGQRIAQIYGAQAGMVLTFLLLTTPLKGWIVDRLIRMTTGPGEALDSSAVHAAITVGISLLVVMQALGTVIAGAIWQHRIGGTAHDGNGQ